MVSDEAAGWAVPGDSLRRPFPSEERRLCVVEGPGRGTRGSSKCGLDAGGRDESRGALVADRCAECDLARGRFGVDSGGSLTSGCCPELDRNLCLRR